MIMIIIIIIENLINKNDKTNVCSICNRNQYRGCKGDWPFSSNYVNYETLIYDCTIRVIVRLLPFVHLKSPFIIIFLLVN